MKFLLLFQTSDRSQPACGRLGRQTFAKTKTFVDMTYPKGWSGSLPLCPFIFSLFKLLRFSRFRVDENGFGKGKLSIIMWLSGRVLLKHKCKIMIIGFWNFFSVVDGEHLMSFQSENAVFKIGLWVRTTLSYFSIKSTDHKHLSLQLRCYSSDANSNSVDITWQQTFF